MRAACAVRRECLAATRSLRRAGLHATSSLRSSDLLEVGASDKVGNIVVIGFLGLSSTLEESLNLLVLFRANLLEDVRNHVLELLGLRIAGGDQQLLTHRELD